MNMEQMTRWKILHGITTCLSIVLLVSSEVIDGANSCCTDGLGLNYTLPMFKECKKRPHSNGSLVQTIPKLISLDSFARCSGREGTPSRPHTYRVCRHPDCERNPCENGWCEETMEGYECHCSPGYEGKACNERSGDVTPPNVTCVEDITITVELGRPTPNTSVEFIQPSATDTSGTALLISTNYASGDEFPVGATIVEYVFADESGNEATCNFTVIVNSIDTTAPDVVCIEDITITVELGRPTPNTSVEYKRPSATDMSGTDLLVSSNYDSGDEFPVGATVVEYVFADESGNEATCNFTVIVNSIDTTAPDVVCIENITVTVELGRPTPNTSVEFIQPSATDTSGTALLVSTNYASGDEFPVGATVVEYVFADESGNKATCNFTVIVNSIDTTAPDVVCSEDITITVELGRPTPNTSVEFIQPSATDTSGTDLLVSSNYDSGDEFPVGATVVKYVFADESGNEATCNFTVIVNSIDTVAPDVVCIEDITVTVELGGSTPETIIEFIQPSATDMSGTALLVSSNYGSGDGFPVGSTLVEYVFADESGNQATCNFTITINTYAFLDPVGIESGAIPDSSMTASSAWDNVHQCLPERARLHLVREEKGENILCGGWLSKYHDTNQWIQVDLLTMYRIDGVSTQGRVHRVQWVTDYKINYSVDGITFDTVQDILTYPATDKVFAGNSDTDTVVYNALPQPKVCRYVRLLPVDWFSKIALRMELYGEPPVMDPDWVCISSKCYRIDAEPLRTWQDAQSFCRDLSPITTISGVKEPSLLFVDIEGYRDIMNRMSLRDQLFWINCNDMLNEGDFICDVDGAGTRETTTYWSPGEPNGPETTENCVVLNSPWHDGWLDVGCNSRFLTVCQLLL